MLVGSTTEGESSEASGHREPWGERRAEALFASTLCEAFQTTAAEWAQAPALRLKDSDYEASFAQYAASVRRRAAGLASLGVGRGDTVGFMLVNRPRVLPHRLRRDAPRRGLLLRLQHRLAGAAT